MSDEKTYDPEMRGALYEETRNKGNDKAPVATGKITISGVELRIAMWSSRVSAESKKKYWPLKVEYRQGTTRFLVPIEPANVVATGTAQVVPADGSATGTPSAETAEDGSIPF